MKNILTTYKNQWIAISLCLVEGFFLFIRYGLHISIPCFSETFLHLQCLGCGITEAFDNLLIQKTWIGFITSNYFAPMILIWVIGLNSCALFDLFSDEKDKSCILWFVKHIIATKLTLGITILCWILNICL